MKRLIILISSISVFAVLAICSAHASSKLDKQLAQCISSVNYSCVKSLLKQGVDPNLPLRVYNRVLRPVGLINYLLFSDKPDSKKSELFAIAKLLIDKGSSIGRGGLYFVVADGESKFLELYLNNGLRPDTVIEGKKLIEIATENNQQEIIKLLVEHGETPYNISKKSTLILIEMMGNLFPHSHNEVDKLITEGGDINGEDSNNLSPLMAACRAPNIDVKKDDILYLLDIGADPNKMANPLFKGFPEATYPANVIIMWFGRKMLKASISTKYKSRMKSGKEILFKMISRGFRISAKDILKQTPLHYAAIYDNIEAAKILVKEGAKKTDRNVDGLTPYDLAESADMIRLLSIKKMK